LIDPSSVASISAVALGPFGHGGLGTCQGATPLKTGLTMLLV